MSVKDLSRTVRERIQLPPGDELLTREQVANILGLTSQTLSMWANRGIGPDFIRITASSIRYRRSAIERFLAARTVTACAAQARV
jgi:predicted DNA-binding transcriptional regulator AlpA